VLAPYFLKARHHLLQAKPTLFTRCLYVRPSHCLHTGAEMGCGGGPAVRMPQAAVAALHCASAVGAAVPVDADSQGRRRGGAAAEARQSAGCRFAEPRAGCICASDAVACRALLQQRRCSAKACIREGVMQYMPCSGLRRRAKFQCAAVMFALCRGRALHDDPRGVFARSQEIARLASLLYM